MTSHVLGTLETRVNQCSSVLKELTFSSKEANKNKCEYTVCQMWKKKLSGTRGIRIVAVGEHSVVMYYVA